MEKTLIGEHVSERLDVTPAKFRVIVTRRSGKQIAGSKYADGRPLYRQEVFYPRPGPSLFASLLLSLAV